MIFEQTPEFQKDLKRLSKKWRSLPSDITKVQRDITPLFVDIENLDRQRIRKAFFNGKRAAILYKTDEVEVVKMRLDVADLGRNDKVRVVFIAIKIESVVRFIELYAKNEKSREDAGRIKKYLS